MDCLAARQPARRGLAHFPHALRSNATSRPGIRLHSASCFHPRCRLGSFVFARPCGTADCFHARRPGQFAACAGSGGRQWHLHARGGLDRNAVHDGVPGGAAHLEPRPPSSKGRSLRDGEPDRGTRRGSGAGAGRVHAATGLRRAAAAHSARGSARYHDRVVWRSATALAAQRRGRHCIRAGSPGRTCIAGAVRMIRSVRPFAAGFPSFIVSTTGATSLMQIAARSLVRVVLVLSAVSLVLPCFAAEKQRLQVNDYAIQAVVSPQTHQIKAQARVRFTALDDITIAIFELHNALRPTRVLDASGQPLSVERVSQDSTIRISLPNGLTKGSSDTLTFEYEGAIQSGDDSPVPGLKLAYIGDPITYLLYSGRWFPMVGYGVNRFTSTISVSVPSEYKVIGSGKQSSGAAAEIATEPAGRKGGATHEGLTKLAVPAGYKTVTFSYEERASFPGTILIGKWEPTKSTEGGLNVTVYTTPEHKALATQYADAAVKEFFFYTSTYSPPFSSTLNVVELPDDTVPSAWAPEIAALASRAFVSKINYRLLANSIAHQWFGTMVSPATKNDWWLNDGSARYSEALYVEHVAGRAGFQEVTKDMSVGALAYLSVS